MPRHFIALCLLLACAAGPAAAQPAAQLSVQSSAPSFDIALIGVIGESAAVIAVDGGEPRTIKVGQTRAGITLRAIERERATIEFQGKTRVLALGQHHRSAGAGIGADGRQIVTLAADPRGHFISEGLVNGGTIRFVVDTGATSVALPAADALRLGIDYRKGQVSHSKTAGGVVPVYVVRLDRVRVGAIELTGVEGVVIEQGLDIALLGMSFLSRVDMRQEGRTMTLTRRF